MRHQYLLCFKHVKSLLKAIRAHPVYFEAQLQTESKPDNFLAFSTAISYHFYISFELQLDKTKAKRQITDCSCLRITTFASSVCDSCLVPWLQQLVLNNLEKTNFRSLTRQSHQYRFRFIIFLGVRPRTPQIFYETPRSCKGLACCRFLIIKFPPPTDGKVHRGGTSET